VRKKSLCHCGSGKIKELCCEKGLQIRTIVQPIANPKEREEFIKKAKICEQFGMRYRGLLEFYGNDLIAYKRKHDTDQNCNEFLRIISKYLTDYLEDYCPSSWQQCQPSFWEELIVTYYPFCMKITPQEKEVEKFHSQLKKFVRWLDKRAHTSWYSVIEEFINEFYSDLKICEHLLNSLILIDFPHIHHDSWNLDQDLEKINQTYSHYTERVDSFFQVTSIYEDTVILTNLKSQRTYHIKGLPQNIMTPGILMHGSIGKINGAMFWNWCHTEGVYPQRAINYLVQNNNGVVMV
jgi:hypothetical protein